mmetsp:Transcript_75543/g.157578  ORF Transcript_75543/g.157578 Transcript_75543/m.157578 type:complete len:97 (+) Transcript_75543:18-308(+)
MLPHLSQLCIVAVPDISFAAGEQDSVSADLLQKMSPSAVGRRAGLEDMSSFAIEERDSILVSADLLQKMLPSAINGLGRRAEREKPALLLHAQQEG